MGAGQVALDQLRALLGLPCGFGLGPLLKVLQSLF